MENFDYSRAIARLEDIAKKAEDPSTGLVEIDRYIEEADKIIASAREYLRSVRDKIEKLDEKA